MKNVMMSDFKIKQKPSMFMPVKKKQNLMDIHAHIKNKQWIKAGQSVDRLTIDIANGTVIFG